MKPLQKPSMDKKGVSQSLGARRRVLNSPSKEGLKAEKALKQAVAGIIEEHRRLGLPIAVMRNGKAVFVNVDKKVSVARERKATYRTKR